MRCTHIRAETSLKNLVYYCDVIYSTCTMRHNEKYL